MRQIHYRINKKGWCYTRCPHKAVFIAKRIYVSSVSCQECEFFGGDDEEKHIVSCRHDEVKEKKREV